MPTLIFQPTNKTVDVTDNAKVLASAIRAQVPIRYGCGACRCGTCAIEVTGQENLTPMAANERELLSKIGLPIEGHIRLACQARILSSTVTVDLSFQDKYSPDEGLHEG